jgi:hypothetical protein
MMVNMSVGALLRTTLRPTVPFVDTNLRSLLLLM